MNSSPPNTPRTPSDAPAAIRALPAGIWALGLGSLFMDTSSELIHSLLPIFMVTVLGGSMVTIGLVEGVAEATAAVTKVFSGALSDYFGKRKFLMVSGYALAALTKPIFPLANSMGWVFAARFVDRVGKGIRGAPRDALVADIAPPRLRGAAYGLRQALDSVGAFLGPMAALAMMAWFANDIRAAMWVAVVPAFITVAILIIGVREPGRAEVGVSEVARSTPPAGATAAAKAPKAPLSLADAKRLPLSFWIVVLLGTQLSLARFSEAFLVLRAQNVGLAIGYVPLIMIVMNVAYAGFAYPAGAAADRLPRRALLLAGLALLVAADLVLAAAVSPLTAFAGAALWGLHMAFTQGLFAKLVADTAPPDLRATAFGVFNLISGVALLLASVIAGALWTAFGPPTTFLAGAALATAAAIGLLAYHAGPQSR